MREVFIFIMLLTFVLGCSSECIKDECNDIKEVELYGVLKASASGRNNITEKIGYLNEAEINLLSNFLYSSSHKKTLMNLWPIAYFKIHYSSGTIKYFGVSYDKEEQGIIIFIDDNALEKPVLAFHECITNANYESKMRNFLLKYSDKLPKSFYNGILMNKNLDDYIIHTGH